MFKNSPLTSIKKFDFADSVRPGKRRQPGECVVLRNTAPNQSGGERVRRGYAAYTAVTAPSSGGFVVDLLKVCQIQSPSQEDVHLWFANDHGAPATQAVFMNPWWDNTGTKQTTNLQLNETISFSGQPVTYPTGTTMALTGAPLAQADNYFKNWILRVGSKAATITGWVQSTNTLTFLEQVNAGGINFGSPITGTLARNFHDNPTLSMGYNTDLANPPTANSQNSIIRLSGGQSSSANNRGIWINPNLVRTFFPVLISGSSYTYTGTYASERECKAVAKANLQAQTVNLNDVATGLGVPKDKTYWIAIAPVYDNFQIGPLTRLEATTDYTAGAQWTNNYLNSTATVDQQITVRLGFQLGFLSKRMTGVRVYLAVDPGNTVTSGRRNQYFYIASASFIATAGDESTGWTQGSLYYTKSIFIDLNAVNSRVNTYVQDSGYVEVPSDTMYAYSDEVLVGESRRYLSNVYISSEGKIDREKLFINPIGGAGNLNAGLVEPDIFSNEDGIYRKAPEPTVGTKIQCMRAIGLEDLLIIKDRGLLLGRQIVDAAGFPDFLWSIISYEVGSATIAQSVQADDGWIYFGGYDDIYRYRGGAYQTAIRRGDSNDWLNTYREVITKTQKESTVIWYLPEGVIYFDIAQTNGYQFALYPEGGWRQVSFKQVSGVASSQFFKWMTRLQNGTILGTTSDSPAQFMQFSNPTDLTFYYSDNGTAIRAQIDTGDFLLAGDESRDAEWDKLIIDTTKDIATTGTLDVSIWKDTVLLKTVSGLPKTTIRMAVHSQTDEQRIGQLWRMAWNVNVSDPEVMQSSGKELRINSIDWYANVLPYLKRATDSVPSEGKACMQEQGTVGGVRQILYTTANVDQSYVFDIPFQSTFLSVDGSNEPKYRITFSRARINGGTGPDVDSQQVVLVGATLTGFSINCPTSNVLIDFAIV